MIDYGEKLRVHNFVQRKSLSQHISESTITPQNLAIPPSIDHEQKLHHRHPPSALPFSTPLPLPFPPSHLLPLTPAAFLIFPSFHPLTPPSLSPLPQSSVPHYPKTQTYPPSSSSSSPRPRPPHGVPSSCSSCRAGGSVSGRIETGFDSIETEIGIGVVF